MIIFIDNVYKKSFFTPGSRPAGLILYAMLTSKGHSWLIPSFIMHAELTCCLCFRSQLHCGNTLYNQLV